MYRKVLYALDIESKENLLKAKAVADQLNTEFHIGYATNLGEVYTDNQIYFGDELGNALSEHAKQNVVNQISTLIQATDIAQKQVHIVDGPIGMAIDHLAQQLDVDLVIVSHSHPHFHLLVKPDTLIRMAAHCDVLSLREQ
ncbi:universal stress protein [Vibrio sp. SM6]|uniref:Universal stress protein n=1 Tax=Vibrio agarilyticus TaxID=2726741 RepID=A0A7X8TSX9_9VIBR|nr:universal stress protein [Vibrio agarilyticus]NLS14241.1 universal stress protein [Vibrio agarilyticus]